MVATSAQAAFVSVSPDPLLGGSLVSSGGPIASPFGFLTFTIANVVETGNSIVGGNDFIDYTASPILTFYSDAAMTSITDSSTLQGGFKIEVFGRSSPFQTGAFNFKFVSSTSSGTVQGTPVSVQLDPSKTSGGTTTITAGPGVGQYTIDTKATQYSQFSVNGGDFASIPALPLTDAPTALPLPEAATMIGAALAGLGALRRRPA